MSKGGTVSGTVVGECMGAPVFARPRKGDMSHELQCTCGNRFCAPVQGITVVGNEWPDVAMATCTDCKSPSGVAFTVGFEVEPTVPSSRIRRLVAA